jgi:hypothetical protein
LNFKNFTFDPAENDNDVYGSFKITSTARKELLFDEYIPIDINKKYYFSISLKSVNATNKSDLIFKCYDIDKNAIDQHHVYHHGTYTTLSADLTEGETVIHFTDLSEWVLTSTNANDLGLIFWNYVDSTGHIYDYNTYSRNSWTGLYSTATVDKTAKTITLTSPWSHGTIPAGTKVS